MTAANPTVAVRIPQEAKEALQAQAEAAGYSSLTELLREVLTARAGAGRTHQERANSCKQQEKTIGRTDYCPITSSSRSDYFCPFLVCSHRMQKPVVENRKSANEVSAIDALDSLLRDLDHDDCLEARAQEIEPKSPPNSTSGLYDKRDSRWKE